MSCISVSHHIGNHF
ncbi:hypothetical protein D029_0880A, partial [Vibrio parahaemolyticus 970107]